MKDKMFHGGAHLKLHNMSLEVWKLQGVPAESLAAAERAGADRADRQREEREAPLRAEMDAVLERSRAMRERHEERSVLRTTIGSLQETERLEVEELERLRAESVAMRRRVDDAKARREKARADLDALHCVYGMNSERAELDEKQAAAINRNAHEEQKRKRCRE